MHKLTEQERKNKTSYILFKTTTASREKLQYLQQRATRDSKHV
jgi:hypothetical protein